MSCWVRGGVGADIDPKVQGWEERGLSSSMPLTVITLSCRYFRAVGTLSITIFIVGENSNAVCLVHLQAKNIVTGDITVHCDRHIGFALC